MNSIALTALLQVSLLATGADTYKTAYQDTVDTGKPLVVLVGADWCPGCQTMRNTVMPKLAARGDLNKVAFAHVNTDREGPLANQLMSGTRIPQLVIYTKTAEGWHVDRMIGAQSPEAVEEFIARATPATTTTMASVHKDQTPTE